MLHEAASTGDSSTLGKLMGDYVIPLYALRARRKGYEVSVMKEMMNQLGMAAGPVRPPLPQLTHADQEDVRRLVEKWKPILD